ncbi:unnamed protein product [Durusdinium trenchii]|uniref:Uncharacterized protein n=1 Tax=Durusdinium trenchii TaxID=1381693 RepID=A0ABP0J842_9DINO
MWRSWRALGGPGLGSGGVPTLPGIYIDGSTATKDCCQWRCPPHVFLFDCGSAPRLTVPRKWNTAGWIIQWSFFSSWLVTIMNLFPRYFLGGYGPGEIDKYRRMFESFWSNYRNVDGQHEVYQKPSCDLGHCIPLALHGDEGRGLAKTPLMVLSIQTIIPSTGENDLSQAQHSYLTRLLYSLIPSSWYSQKEETLDFLLGALATDLREGFNSGIVVNVGGQQEVKFFPVIVAIKGDWPFVRKACHLSSGYRSKRVCHLCPSEEWWDVSANGQARSWSGPSPCPFKQKWSPLRSIPGCDNPDRIQPDLLHVWNLGVGGDMCASTILMLSNKVRVIFQGRSLQACLDDAYGKFHSWCVDNRSTTSIMSFEKTKFKVIQPNQFPRGCGKAYDTALLCKWLHFELEQHCLESEASEHQDLLQLLRWTFSAADVFLRTIYNEGVWMPRASAEAVVRAGFALGEGYTALASLCASRGWRYYRIRPKVHLLPHIVRDVEKQLGNPRASWIANPVIYAVWSDEDYIGRISRLARRIRAGGLQVVRRLGR